MGRQVRRVPANFDWPLGKVWDGFLMPEWLHAASCPDCENGLSADGKRLQDEWYGHRPFDPISTGSSPYTVDTPAVRAFAQRNVERSPKFCGSGESAIIREAERLLAYWNKQWMHHLSQQDVDTLVAEDRLWDFTRVFVPGSGWQDREEPHHPTAAEVNAWSLGGFGHDSINAHIVIRARCEREGLTYVCGTCGGSASRELFVGQEALAEAWTAIEPPTGEWWQIWETVSEGSPITPAYESAEDLARAYAREKNGDVAATLAWITGGGWAPSGIAVGGTFRTADEIITKEA